MSRKAMAASLEERGVRNASEAQIKRYETPGHKASPSMEVVRGIAEIADIPEAWLVSGDLQRPDLGFPVDPPPEGHWILGFLEAHMTTARNSGAEDPIQVAFEATEARVLERRAQGDLSDEGYAYWLAIRLGAVLAEGYAPEDPEPEDPAVPDSRSNAA